MKIKNSLVFAFLVWMEKGDHTIRYKKNHFVMKKNGKIATIAYFDKDDYLEINQYCIERYQLFLYQWFKFGEDFLNKLKQHGAVQVMKNRSKNYMEMY